MQDGKLIRAAVIGCGGIANEHLPYLAASPRVSLVGVCDKSKASAEFARKRFGAEASFQDAGEMLESLHPDIVHILTPPQTHAPLATLALEAGAHVICEKPMTGTARDTAALLTVAARHGKWLIESRNLLFNDNVLEIDKLIGKGALGEVREVEVLLSLDLTAGPFGDVNLEGPGVQVPGGAVHDFLPHLVYLFLHFAKGAGPIARVCGALDNLSENPRVGFDHLDALILAERCRGRLRIASDLKPDMFRLIVRGTKAHIETDFYNPFLRFQRAGDAGKLAPFEQIRSGWRLARSGLGNLRNKVLQHGTYHGLPRMLEAVYAALQQGSDAPILAADMLATAELTDRLLELQAAQ